MILRIIAIGSWDTHRRSRGKIKEIDYRPESKIIQIIQHKKTIKLDYSSYFKINE